MHHDTQFLDMTVQSSQGVAKTPGATWLHQLLVLNILQGELEPWGKQTLQIRVFCCRTPHQETSFKMIINDNPDQWWAREYQGISSWYVLIFPGPLLTWIIIDYHFEASFLMRPYWRAEAWWCFWLSTQVVLYLLDELTLTRTHSSGTSCVHSPNVIWCPLILW